MWEWLAIGAVALVWEAVGIYSKHRQRVHGPWSDTSLTWLIVRVETAHRWTRWVTVAFWLWLGFHFFVQHWVS